MPQLRWRRLPSRSGSRPMTAGPRCSRDTHDHYRQTLDFLLYDWLDVESLRERARFADHSRETFDAVLDTCERIAREKYAPFNRLVDTEEPRFDGEKVHLPQATPRRARAPTPSRACSRAAQDYEIGGMQLPCVVEMAANSFFSKAAHRHRRRRHADQRQRQPADGARHADAEGGVRASNEFAGRFSGTMCLSRAAGRLVASPTSPRAPCPTAPTSRATRSARAIA